MAGQGGDNNTKNGRWKGLKGRGGDEGLRVKVKGILESIISKPSISFMIDRWMNGQMEGWIDRWMD